MARVLDILNNGSDPGPINKIHICLIPKIKKPRHTRDFRPIALCNVLLKLVTKTIANRIKPLLPESVSSHQSAFVPGRLITDNALLAFDTFHYMRKKKSGRKGYIGLKLDMAKTYDRIEWNFLEATLSSMGFPDDSIIFFRSTDQEILTIIHILELYQQASGQLINLDKSELSFSRNVPLDRQIMIQGWIQVKAVDNHSKYLGMPTFVGRSKSQIFEFVRDRVWKNLKGWKEKFLSTAGREVLIKSMVQSIPCYIMGCFLLPQSLCDSIEVMINKFWWRGKGEGRKLHWLSWKRLCVPKQEGGMGFRSFHSFNLALLAKQGWRMMVNQNSFMTQCLKARYFPRTSFIHAPLGYNPNFTWRSIHSAQWVLQRGAFWTIGDGKSVNIWQDGWLPQQPGHHIWSLAPANSEFSFVEALIQPGANCWNVNLLRDLFSDFEVDQITSISLPRRPRNDMLCWEGSKNGAHTVRSAYHFINKQLDNVNSSSNHVSDHDKRIWKSIWKIHTIPRHKHFI